MKPANWTGTITMRYLDTGAVEKVHNAILDGGLAMTAELWLGNTTEQFAQLQIENTDGTSTVAKSVTGSYTVSGGEAVVTTSAIYSSSEVSFDVATVALLGSAGTRIAEAAVNIPAGNAVEVTRDDTLSEVV